MKNIYKALAAFQQECPVIHKGTDGYGYTYADLPDIFKVIMPLLKEHGLGFTQPLKDNGLETIVFHIESGEEIRSWSAIPAGVSLAKMNEFQVFGSACTYWRRYALSSILGIITDKDTDAQGDTTSSATKSVVISKPAPRTKAVVQDAGVQDYSTDPTSDDEFWRSQGVGETEAPAMKQCATCVNHFEVKPGKEWATTCFDCWKKANPIKK